VVLRWFARGSSYLTRTTLTTMRGSIIEDIPVTDAQFGLLTTAFRHSSLNSARDPARQERRVLESACG
jgi:hypothetical protein